MTRSHDDLQAAPPRPRRRAAHAAALAAVALVAVGLVGCTKRKAEPAPLDPATYDRVVGLFYSGLGALDSGVQNDLAAAMFTTMTQLAPAEPAGWANLAVARLRMGDSDAAATALAEADKDVDDSRITFLGGLIASRTGNAEEALTLWRAAIEKDPGNLRAQYALIQELARQASPEAEAEIRTHLAAILAADPANLKALLDTARAAARSGDAPALTAAVDAIAARTDELVASVSADQRQVAADLPALIAELQAAAKGDPKALASQLAMLDNLSRATEVFRVDLAKLTSSDQVIGEPITAFMVLPVPSATPAEADGTVTFEERVLDDGGAAAPTTSTVAISLTSTVSATAPTSWLRAMALFTDASPVPIGPSADGASLIVRTTPPMTLVLTSGPITANGVALFDADNDRRMDIAVVGPKGLQLWRQVSRGAFEDVSAALGLSETVTAATYHGLWSLDLELDGDLDLVMARPSAPGLPAANVVLHNNGDGSWAVAPATGLESPGLNGLTWLDIDADGVNDVVGTDEVGRLVAFTNLRGGQFKRIENFLSRDEAREGIGKLAVADMNGDGRLNIVAADPLGPTVIDGAADGRGMWTLDTIVHVTHFSDAPNPPTWVFDVICADLDNNGAIDLVTFDSGANRIALNGSDDPTGWDFIKLPATVRITDIADLDADHRIDLLGVNAAGQPVVLMNQGGQKAYHAVTLQARAAEAADQRINSFAIGGAVEARSGRLTQKVPIDGPYIHIGLGDRTTAELVRFTWPNGTIQPEFDVAVDTPVIVEQRLKGSCPWLYAWDGTAMAFVTDVLWKSPLGLRLNAQDTAGVVTTQDWVKVRGDQLKPRVDGGGGGDGDGDGDVGRATFDLRVTGELWETHYWDWFGLIAVDHAPDVEVWVDERFVVPPAPLTVQPTGPVQAVAAAVDHRGRDVTDLVADRDNLYLDTFALGKYQGLAEDHWVELAIDPAAVGGDLTNAVVIAQGWLYPTDSSINVALGQGTGPKPQALSLETMDGNGGWTVVEPFIGFPAGKGKTMLIDLGKLAEAPRDDAGLVRLRLRNSMEIYWDRLGVARRLPADVATVTTATLRSAVMGYHGFSMTNQYARGVQGPGAVPRSQPDTPDYNHIAATVPIWLDLAGWYTRYGPVEPLLAAIDDRYVIVNAGDEVRLAFDDVAPPADGLARDYVFQSDGWNKDGDFNTAYSATVHPLPSHDNPMYVDQQVYGATGALVDDPVYRANANDWATYHTRYVSPLPVQRALWGEDR
ncbi:MAG: VCBS repeat-containing protein [Ardenticatenales bacterium]|nr:VCBS repeat-containing protein [Ardenticatenales bacterium]